MDINSLYRGLLGVSDEPSGLGLLDPTDAQRRQAVNQGLLSMGAQIANASGAQRLPVSFGQVLSSGMLAGNQGYNAGIKTAYDQQKENVMNNAALQNYQRQNMMMDYARQIMEGGTHGQAQQSQPAISQQGPYAQGYNNPPSLLPTNQQPQNGLLGSQQPLARMGLAFGVLKQDPAAILSANDQLNPKVIPLREGAPGINPYTGEIITQNPKVPEGTYFDPKANNGTGGIVRVPGMDQASAANAASKVVGELTAKNPLTMAEPRKTSQGQVNYLTNQQAIDAANAQLRGKGAGGATGGAGGYGPTIEGEKYSGKLADAREDYTKAAMAAHEALPSLQLMKDSLVNGLKTNNLAEYTTGFSGWMQSFGIDPTQYGINDPTNAQEFQKGATKLVADMTRSLGGREPFQAMQFVQKGNPGMGNTTEANIKLTSIAEGTKLWEIARDQEAQKWAQNHNGTTDGFIQSFTAQNPVSKFWEKSYSDLKKQVGDAALNQPIVKPIKQAPNASAVPLENADGWKLHVDSDGHKAYVSPNGKQFKEIQ